MPHDSRAAQEAVKHWFAECERVRVWRRTTLAKLLFDRLGRDRTNPGDVGAPGAYPDVVITAQWHQRRGRRVGCMALQPERPPACPRGTVTGCVPI